jgi:uncharacterized protein (TIGR02646 family)
VKYIRKLPPPPALERYRRQRGACYNKLPSPIKRLVHHQLMKEQGYLCCYCGARIEDRTSNIEHFKPKDPRLYPKLQLEYSNLLSSCLGGQIDRRANKHYPLSCDAKKSNRVIPISPTDPHCEQYFRYDEDGNVFGRTPGAKRTVQILGLNNPVLCSRRRAAIRPYLELELSAQEWEEELDFVLSRNREGAFLPYCMAAAWFIRHERLDLPEPAIPVENERMPQLRYRIRRIEVRIG